MKEETLQRKQAVVDEIKQALDEANSMIIVGYTGVSVKDITELRAKYRAENVNYKVYKNTMVRRALHDQGHEDLDEYLNGPNAFVFSNEDMAAGARITGEYAKKNEGKMEVKAGLLDGQVIGADQVKKLASLPSKEVLLSMVLRGLQGPISGLASVSHAILSSLVYALNAIKEEKEEEAA